MKMIYLILLTVSGTVLIFMSAVTIAIPPEEMFAARLAKMPEKWNLVFSENESEDFYHSHTEETVKSQLVKFLSKNRMPTYKKQDYFACALLIIAAFSLVGYVRENRFKKERLNSNCHPADGDQQ